MDKLIRLIPSIVPILTGLLAMYSVELQGYIMQHPSIAMVLTSLYAVLTHIIPSPVGPRIPPDAIPPEVK